VVITFTQGNITTTTTEQSICDITADQQFATWIFTNNLQSGDSVRVKVYIKDDNTTTLRLYGEQDIEGAQTKTAFLIPITSAKQYKVTIQKIAGIDRSFSWLRAEI